MEDGTPAGGDGAVMCDGGEVPKGVGAKAAGTRRQGVGETGRREKRILLRDADADLCDGEMLKTLKLKRKAKPNDSVKTEDDGKSSVVEAPSKVCSLQSSGIWLLLMQVRSTSVVSAAQSTLHCTLHSALCKFRTTLVRSGAYLKLDGLKRTVGGTVRSDTGTTLRVGALESWRWRPQATAVLQGTYSDPHSVGRLLISTHSAGMKQASTAPAFQVGLHLQLQGETVASGAGRPLTDAPHGSHGSHVPTFPCLRQAVPSMNPWVAVARLRRGKVTTRLAIGASLALIGPRRYLGGR
ncbi:hypothetical protein G7046_g8660 [Stylonectria norvegica]|nr:hypothetical protein G7046_g8660 [Stylonectria norvegica]